MLQPKFLLYVSYKYGFPIVRPLQDELIKRGYEVAWFIEIEENKKFLKTNDYLLNSIEEVLEYDADINLVSSNEIPHFFPGIKVQVFHGFSVDKRSHKKGHFRIRGLFDLYCTQGPSTTREFKKLSYKHKHFDVIETGWSKVDDLFPIQKKENKRPIILVASTFTKSMSLAHDDEVFEEVKRIIKLNNWDWLITLHPKMDIEIVKKFKSIKEKNVTYIENLNDLEPLKIADVMLSDTSSVITEFLIQYKPVVTYKNKNPKRHLINIKTADEIKQSILSALELPQELMSNIKSYVDEIHPYNDGKSSARVIDATLLFIKENRKKRLKSKPLNLIRKYKMCKKFKYFKL